MALFCVLKADPANGSHRDCRKWVARKVRSVVPPLAIRVIGSGGGGRGAEEASGGGLG